MRDGNMVCDIPPEMAAALVAHLILLLLEKLRQRYIKKAHIIFKIITFIITFGTILPNVI
jgi:hypothetical protein